MKKQIKHELAEKQAGHVFAGQDVTQAFKMKWQNVDDKDDFGHYYIADTALGYYLAGDETHIIAAGSLKRIRKFLYRGIRNRCLGLVQHYLKDIIEVGPDDYCINFGANIGELSIGLRDKGASVLAIEPDINLTAALLDNSRRYGFSCLPVALWNEDTNLKINLDTDNGDTSVFGETVEVAYVRGVRLDSIIQVKSGRIKLLVGDAEGAEPEVLEGARNTLKNTEYVSLRASAERNGVDTLVDCRRLLEQAGFEIVYQEDKGFCILIGHNKRFQ